MQHLFLFLGLISATVFICLRTAEVKIKHAILKGVSSLFFILTAVFSFVANSNCTPIFGALIIVGAVFGMIGDVSLDFKYVYKNDMNVYLNMGFIAFLIGHLFYSLALMSAYGITFKSTVFGLIGAIVMLVSVPLSEKILPLKFGKFKFVSAVYMAVLGFTVGLSLGIAITEHFTVHTLLFFIGMMLFIISDAVLSGIYFGIDEKERNKRLPIVVNHIVYYAAQFTIAFSLNFYKG